MSVSCPTGSLRLCPLQYVAISARSEVGPDLGSQRPRGVACSQAKALRHPVSEPGALTLGIPTIYIHRFSMGVYCRDTGRTVWGCLARVLSEVGLRCDAIASPSQGTCTNLVKQLAASCRACEATVCWSVVAPRLRCATPQGTFTDHLERSTGPHKAEVTTSSQRNSQQWGARYTRAWV